MDVRALAATIDHTLLKPDATRAQIERLCDEAREHGFCAVCVAPYWLRLAKERLASSAVRLATIIGFPHGSTLTAAKATEAAAALSAGADELDMVLNVGALKSGDHDAVRADIAAVVGAARAARGPLVKVILETALLTDEEKQVACRLAEQAGADFVKTCTGFSGGGASTHDVALMVAAVGGRLGVKASGGIRDAQTALAMLSAGASRLGTSASVAIVREHAASVGR